MLLLSLVASGYARDPLRTFDNGFLTFGLLSSTDVSSTDCVPDADWYGKTGCTALDSKTVANGPPVTKHGLLGAPYYSFVSGTDLYWRNLTYDQMPMELAISVGTVGDADWLGGFDTKYSNYYDAEDIDDTLTTLPLTSLPVITSSSDTLGATISATGATLTLSATETTAVELVIDHVYELPANGNFVKATTTVTASGTDAPAVRVFVGTWDDYIAGSDDTSKTRGNIVDGAFVSLTDATRSEPSNSVLITGEDAGILFFANIEQGQRADALIAETYEVNDSCSQSSEEINCFEEPGDSPPHIDDDDGAYAIAVQMGTIPAGVSKSFSWFYAAGAVEELDNVVGDVSEAAPPGAPVTVPEVAIATSNGTSQLRNVPFTLTINLEDETGNPLTATQDVELTLTATGGSQPGQLRKVGALDENVTVTLPTGKSSISITDLIYTGLSDPNGGLDVTITATSNGAYPDATLAISVRDISMTVASGSASLPADGVATTPLTVTLKDTEGNAVPDTNITITTTLGTLLDENGDPLTNPVTLATDENGEIRLTLQAGTEFGAATISVQCPGACTRTTTVNLVSPDVTAPSDLVVIPGNQKIWLVFTKSQGTVANYQYQLDGGAWIDIPADVQLPYLITERPNGVQVTVTVRAIDQNGDPSAQSNASTGTPTIIGEPEAALGIQDDDTIIEIPLQNGKGLLTMTFTFRNEGTETLTNMWIEENDLSPKGRVIELKDAQGNVLPQYGDRWFWQGVNLAPGATIQGTLTMEIEE